MQRSHPDFQREEIWSLPAKTRFLDSLLKNLPIPSLCICLDVSTQKRIVIDGLQRISTIVKFLSEVENGNTTYSLSRLEDIDDRLSGMLVNKLAPDVISNIENVSIPVTVLRCDLSQNNHMNYIFTIFHRLNTGGMKLNNQEIRNCIFNGTFNNLLFECSEKNKAILDTLLKSDGKRFAFAEFVLRFFAFQDKLDSYNGKLANFLNNYMKDNKDIESSLSESKKELFSRVISFTASMSIDKTSKTILEAIFYGVGKNIEHLESLDDTYRKEIAKKILELQEFSPENLKSSLSSANKVQERLNSVDSYLKSFLLEIQ